jgi:DNA-binding GntR family transcriptional regulator
MPDTEKLGDVGPNVTTAIHGRLRSAILDGRVAPGEMSQVALADQLGVSRTPLREAIRMLQREGLVVAEPNRRVRITELSAADAEALYLSRVVLESGAARVTVPVLASSQIAELEGYMAQMDHFVRQRDYPGFEKPHKAFHAILVAGAGEPVVALIAQLSDHVERYRFRFGPVLWDRGEEHRSILAAAAAGDASTAVRELLTHYAQTAALVFDGLGGGHDPERLRSALAELAPGAERPLEAG